MTDYTAREAEAAAREAAIQVIREAQRLFRAAGKAPDGRLFTFAESCTGGLAASFAADVPGASDFFPGSIVAYSERAKVELLDVTPETLARHGAVSGECAAEMARGAAARMRARFAVSVTGFAGPGGGTPKNPVGTVWLAVCRDDGAARLMRARYRGDRTTVRAKAAAAALSMLLRALRGERHITEV